MTKKGTVVVIAVLALLTAALISRERVFGLLAIPFLVYLLVGAYFMPGEVEISASIQLDQRRGRENHPVRMTVHLAHHGSKWINFHLVDLFQPGMKAVNGTEWLSSNLALPAGETLEFALNFTAARGVYRWNNLNLVATDPFTLFENKKQIAVSAELVMLPDWVKLRGVKFHPQKTLSIPGINPSHQPGVGTDFWGVREFHSGDSIRWIDWRHTATQRRTIITKEFEREDAADFGIILDARASINRIDGNQSLFEHSVEAALALSEMFVNAGNRDTLLVLGKKLIRVFPGSGREHLTLIKDKLAACELSDLPALADLRYLPLRLFPGRAMVILISPLGRSDADTIARLCRHGYQLLILSPCPTAMDPSAAQEEAHGLAGRAVALERAVLHWKLRSMGAVVIDWPVDQSLHSVLCKCQLLRVRQRRRV